MAPIPPIDVLATVAAELAETHRAAGDLAEARAVDKAALQLHSGLQPVETHGGYLVTSATRGGMVHRVSSEHGCTCEAATNGRPCWHAALVAIVTLAGERRLEKPRYRITREMVDAGREARQERHAQAFAAMDELFS